MCACFRFVGLLPLALVYWRSQKAMGIISSEDELKTICENNTTRKWSDSTRACFEYISSPVSTFKEAEESCSINAPNGTVGRLAHITDSNSLRAVHSLAANGWVGAERIIIQDCTDTSPEDCAKIKTKNASAVTGIYTIKLISGNCDDMFGGLHTMTRMCCVQVYCDMDRFGGGWTVFQKRYDGTVDFHRNWAEYEVGFGSLYTEFYAGNKFINYFTTKKSYELLVELDQSTERCKVYAHYASFSIADNTDKYKLSMSSWLGGTAGDSLTHHNDTLFSTYDQDNDKRLGSNCAAVHSNRGGWWYVNCFASNLNGAYFDGCTSFYSKGILWMHARRFYYSFRGSEMKLRPANYSLHNPEDKHQLCPKDYIPTPCPQDCQWSSWSSWGSCDSVQYSSIHGRMVRTRSRIYPLNDGQLLQAVLPCQGKGSDIKFCNIHDTTSLPDCDESTPQDCSEIKTANQFVPTGIYTIKLKGGSCDGVSGTEIGGRCCVAVYCDMDRFGGGWTVFQKRQDGSTDFYRSWAQYEAGFGSLSGEFYAGNKFLNYFTGRQTYELLVELDQSAEKCKIYAMYSSFSISDSTDKYRLAVGTFVAGNSGDSMAYHNQMPFTTFDQDNDPRPENNTAVMYKGIIYNLRDTMAEIRETLKGGWWYNVGHASNLNGEYYDGCASTYSPHRVTWNYNRGFFYSFKSSEMKLRPVNYSHHKSEENAQLCATDYIFTPCSQDCNWNPWSSWGSCNPLDDSTIHGKMVRTRSKSQTPFRAADCQGESVETKFCSIETTSVSDWRWIEKNTLVSDLNSQLILSNLMSLPGHDSHCLHLNKSTFQNKACYERHGKLCEYYLPRKTVNLTCQAVDKRPGTKFLLHSLNRKPQNNAIFGGELQAALFCTRHCWLTCCSAVAYNTITKMCYTYAENVDNLVLVPEPGVEFFVKQ